jgi:hypothetical protein
MKKQIGILVLVVFVIGIGGLSMGCLDKEAEPVYGYVEYTTTVYETEIVGYQPVYGYYDTIEIVEEWAIVNYEVTPHWYGDTVVEIYDWVEVEYTVVEYGVVDNIAIYGEIPHTVTETVWEIVG